MNRTIGDHAPRDADDFWTNPGVTEMVSRLQFIVDLEWVNGQDRTKHGAPAPERRWTTVMEIRQHAKIFGK